MKKNSAFQWTYKLMPIKLEIDVKVENRLKQKSIVKSLLNHL